MRDRLIFFGEKSNETPDDSFEFQEKGIDFLGEKSTDKTKIVNGFEESVTRGVNFGSQELTLSYLCENSRLGFPEKDHSGKNLLNSLEKLKGKEIPTHEDESEGDDNMWVERDFLQLNENRPNSSKRDGTNLGIEPENNKKPKVESLDLSLALPDFSLPGSNTDLPTRLLPNRIGQLIGTSSNNTQTTAYSMSQSFSHAHSHNPSCSLTRNSTENFDPIWNCGEGTNGSVHSRFRPVGDGTVTLSNHNHNHNHNHNGGGGGGGYNSLYRTTSSDSLSFFPSELPARPGTEGQMESSFRDSDDLTFARDRNVSKPQRIVTEIVSESIPVMAQIIQELTDETLEAVKSFLMNIINNPERKNELNGLQTRLERRSDLTRETLSRCNKTQLEILIAIKLGLITFLHSKNKLPTPELIEIFLLERCRNTGCRRLLPVEDCECKICSNKKGFCSECMCPICFEFDSASNTCSWVGCDVCSHWCHASCGLHKNLIRPGPGLKGQNGKNEMQFNCLGCGHASEMFGFVKDVFLSCAKDWDYGTLVRELDCVRRVFVGSEDRKGKELSFKAEEMMRELEGKRVTTMDACKVVFKFFQYADGLFDSSSSDLPTQLSFGKDASLPLPNSLAPNATFYNNTDSSNGPFENKVIEDEWSVKPLKKDGFNSLESLIRVKEAEARMFQNRADEAQREAENIRKMMRIKTEKLELEYAEKVAKLCLEQTEERQRKKIEELKELENSHCDYYKMKMRMQSEISGLLKRMEATKQQMV